MAVDINVLKNIFRSLQYRNFRLYFAGQSISLIGTWIQRVTMPWLIFSLTKSAFLLGLIVFIGQIPSLLLSPYAGVLSDRVNRYRLLLATQILSLIQASILAILFISGVIEIWHIILLSIFLGCINAFDIPVRQSFVIQMVDKKEDLGNAIALNSSMVNGARLIGPSIAGILIATFGEGSCFLVNALSYVFVIASLLFMTISASKTKKKSSHIFKDLKEGFKYTFGFPYIKNIILLLALVSLMGMPYIVIMPVITKEVFQGNPQAFGFLMGASGLGALFSALYLASRQSVKGLGKIISFAAATFGFGLIAFSFSRFYPLSLFFMMISGLGMMLQIASSNTILQTLVDDHMRGRVMSFYSMAFMGISPFGSLIAGAMSKAIGASNTLMIGGTFCILGAIIFGRKIKAIRNMSGSSPLLRTGNPE